MATYGLKMSTFDSRGRYRSDSRASLPFLPIPNESTEPPGESVVGSEHWRHAALNEAAVRRTLSRAADPAFEAVGIVWDAEEELSVNQLRQLMLEELHPATSPIQPSAPTCTVLRISASTSVVRLISLVLRRFAGIRQPYSPCSSSARTP